MTALRWVLWLGVCVGVGIGLGLATMPPGADARGEGAAAALRTHAVARGAPPDRGPPRETRFRREAAASAPPRIAIVIDDLGLDRRAFDRVNALPGPLTLAFLPYGRDAQAMLDATRPAHEAILHLPAEPMVRVADAGPDMLRVADEAAIRAALDANLAKLSGFVGVNNHTGSRFTGDARAMATLLGALDARQLYFLDSVTTANPVAADLAGERGWRVVERDVFLDDDYDGGAATVRAQLAEVERIARIEGQAIAIGHPYRATAEALGPWLVTAQARGFELVTVGELAGPAARPRLAGLR